MKNYKIFFPNLNGLRFFAFVSVFISHSMFTKDPGICADPIYKTFFFIKSSGIFGVNLFFVLSGFLITYLLLDERDKTGKINIGAFYIRRILRIWPLYYLVVLIGWFLIPLAFRFLGESYHEPTKLPWFIFFISNLHAVKPATAILGVLWSIAVEEQFYLVWPILIKWCPKRLYPFLFSMLIVISYIFRLYHPEDWEHTLTCISDLVVGSWVAVLAYNKHPLINKIASTSKKWNILIYLASIAFILTHSLIAIHFLYPFYRILFSCFFAFIIIEQTYSTNSWYKSSKLKFADFWGYYTYGLYMFHFIVIYFVGRLFRNFFEPNLFNTVFTQTVVTFIISLLAAYLSYTYFEKPFLRLKEKFSYTKRKTN